VSLEDVAAEKLAEIRARGTHRRMRVLEGAQGPRMRVDGRDVAVGTSALLGELGADPGSLGERAEELRAQGQTVFFVAVDGRAAGLLAVADPVSHTGCEAAASAGNRERRLDRARTRRGRTLLATGPAEHRRAVDNRPSHWARPT